MVVEGRSFGNLMADGVDGEMPRLSYKTCLPVSLQQAWKHTLSMSNMGLRDG